MSALAETYYQTDNNKRLDAQSAGCVCVCVGRVLSVTGSTKAKPLKQGTSSHVAKYKQQMQHPNVHEFKALAMNIHVLLFHDLGCLLSTLEVN